MCTNCATQTSTPLRPGWRCSHVGFVPYEDYLAYPVAIYLPITPAPPACLHKKPLPSPPYAVSSLEKQSSTNI
ncbi:hypothetical protein Pdw03_2925 [Penicillium digitatum]|uniref:Uncharacterized protein n=1 Tax=Penicillium digitatum TaxID=36651 RepID=A0A7T7BHP8_PENDI|nr:hypothetical protein Pdw03_2925 [Penicillium digitatum]